jgi:DNA-directed RNA polymerase subunit RPC12/RpoP
LKVLQHIKESNSLDNKKKRFLEQRNQMASALQLFNFQPQRTVALVHSEGKKKRKRKVIAQVPTGKVVNYSCSGCEKEISIDTNASIQCPFCNNRIVDKLRSKKAITYNAD